MKIYLDGKFVDDAEAKVSVFDHGLLYGDGVFEGIRLYGRNIFRLDEHLERLEYSAKAILLTLPLTLGMGQWINPFVSFGLAEWSLVATATIHALAYATYVWIAGAAGAVFAAQTAYIVTGSGIVWAMLLLGERYSGWVWAALGAMMVGVLLVQPRKADGVEAAPDAGETPHQ